MTLLLGMLVKEQVTIFELNQKILDKLVEDEANKAQQNEERDAIYEIDENIALIRSKIEKALENVIIPTLQASIALGSGGSGAKGYRYPKIEIKKYSGE